MKDESQNFTARHAFQALAMEMDYQMTLIDAVQIVQGFKLTAPEIPIAPEPLPVVKFDAAEADMMWRVDL